MAEIGCDALDAEKGKRKIEKTRHAGHEVAEPRLWAGKDCLPQSTRVARRRTGHRYTHTHIVHTRVFVTLVCILQSFERRRKGGQKLYGKCYHAKSPIVDIRTSFELLTKL